MRTTMTTGRPHGTSRLGWRCLISMPALCHGRSVIDCLECSRRGHGPIRSWCDGEDEVQPWWVKTPRFILHLPQEDIDMSTTEGFVVPAGGGKHFDTPT